MRADRDGFGNERLQERAAAVLGGKELALPPGEELFKEDASGPLPALPEVSSRLPSFVDLFRIVPDPYAREIEEAYLLMGDFALRLWGPLSGVVFAEPFFEWMMHADVFSPHYRDHIVHQVRVAAIGDAIVEKTAANHPFGRSLARLAREVEEWGVTKDPRRFVRLAWWLAALFHDCAYPYEFHAGYFRQLEDIYKVGLAGPAATSWFACFNELDDLAGGLDSRDFHNCEDGRHCFLSAAELAMEEAAHRQGLGREDPKEIRDRRRRLLQLAVRAVLRHHALIPKQKDLPPDPQVVEDAGVLLAAVPHDNLLATGHPRLRRARDPLAFLLVLSDELHEAGRPCSSAWADEAERASTVRYHPGEITAVSLEWKDRPESLLLTYTCAQPTRTIRGKTVAHWARDKWRTLYAALDLPAESLVVRVEGAGAVPLEARA